MSASPQLRIVGHDRPPVTVGRIGDFADDPVACMRGLWAEHGEICALQEDLQRLHFVFGPQYTKQVLSDSQRFHSAFFAVRGPRNSAQRRVTSGLLSMNGEQHKEHRRVVMGPFQKRMIGAYRDTVAHTTREMLATWQAGETRDMSHEMTRYMLRLTASTLFGLHDAELAYHVGELIENWVALNHRIGPAAFASDPALAAQYDELLHAAEELEVAVKELVQIKRSLPPAFDVLSMLLHAHDDTAQVSDDQLVGHIVLLFGAAHLTSAHSLTWTLFLLAQHPEVMSELYAEMQAINPSGTPTLEQIESMDCLDRVLKESMRVLPASAYSQRIAAEPVELGPFQLNPGAVVIFSQFITHHMPELFAEPERFLPERWRTLSPSPYAYLPFGAGPRMCIGASLGTMQLKLTLPTILNEFKLNVVPHAKIEGRVLSTMLFPLSTVPMSIERQDGQFVSTPVSGNIHSLVDLPATAATQQRRAA